MNTTDQVNGLRAIISQAVGLISFHRRPRAASLRSLPWADGSQAVGLITKGSRTDSQIEDISSGERQRAGDLSAYWHADAKPFA